MTNVVREHQRSKVHHCRDCCRGDGVIDVDIDQKVHFVDFMIAFASVGGPDGGWMVVDGEWMWW